MGTWGTGLFENDWALDWAGELAAADDADFPASTLRPFDDGGSLDGPECAAALAAAETIAASAGQRAAGLPDAVEMWIERARTRVGAEDVQLALRVVGMILEQNSELRDQQDETGANLAEWLTPIEDLQRRLSAISVAPAGAVGGGTPRSASRRLHDLVARREPSGSRSRDDVPGVECAWRKVRGGVLFSLRDARGLAVTLDTSRGGRPRDMSDEAGLRRHAPLYIWGDAAGTWPDRMTRLTRCPVYDDMGYHWDDLAAPDTSAALVDGWLAADGDDDVVWAELDREYDELTRKYETFIPGARALVVAALRERGREQDAAALASWDLPRTEAWLVRSEKKHITAEHDRLDAGVQRWRERVAETNAR
jgi:hypothetical protein